MSLINIPVYRLEDLAERIARLNARGRKMGIPQVATWAKAGPEFVHKFARSEGEEVMGFDFYTGAITKQPIEVTVLAEAKLAGWTFLGVIDHAEASPIVRSVPGKLVPESFRDRGPVCDHCQHDRKRHTTYVCQNETGALVQVGSTCIADFLGHKNAEAIAKLCSLVAGFSGSLDDLDDIGEYGSRAKPEYFVEQILLVAAAVVRNNGGYVTAARSQDEGLESTSSTVRGVLMGGEAAATKLGINSQDGEIAAGALAWVRNGGLHGNTEYVLNLNALVASEAVGTKNIGIVASAVACYERHLAEKRAASNTNSKHLGEVGKRLTLILTVERTRVSEGSYGLTTMVQFRDAEGNIATWFASGDKVDDFKVGETLKVKATIKKHGDYKGVAQTTLSRVAVQV